MTITNDRNVVELARVVQTAEGSRYYGLPIGAIISTDKKNKVDAEKAARGIKPPTGALAETDRPPGAPIGKVKTPAKKKPLKLKVKKTELKGNKHFSVGKSKYTAPNGSRVVRPRNQPDLAYIVTPEGEVHVFNAAGEVEIPKEMMDQFKERFGVEFDPADEKYEEAQFDATSSPYDIESLNPGSVLTDTDGTPQFEKMEDGTWEHIDLGVSIDEKELKELYDSGDLLPAEGAANDVATAAFDMSEATNFNTMEKEEFQTALDGFPENTVLNHGEKKFTKTAEGDWSTEDGVSVPSKTLFLVKNKLSVTGAVDPNAKEQEEAVAPKPNPLDAKANTAARLRVGQAATAEWATNAPVGAEVTYTSEDGNETVWVKDKGKWTVGNEAGGYAAVSIDEETFAKGLQAPDANVKVSKLMPDPEETDATGKKTPTAATAAPTEPELVLPEGVPDNSTELAPEDFQGLAPGSVIYQQIGEDEPIGFRKINDTQWVDLDPDMGYVWESDNFESGTLFKAPATAEVENGLSLYEGGPEFSKDDVLSVIDALEMHSGFQISYGLKNIPGSPLAETGVLNELKEAAAEKYPELRPKQALIRYLKAAAGVENKKPSEDPDAPRIKIGSDTAVMGVQGFDGGEFLAEDIIEAIDILEGFSGKLFKAELNKKDNPLGLLDPNKVVKSDKDKTVTKQNFIEMLKDKLAALESNSAPE
jgi:hypothetical protein